MKPHLYSAPFVVMQDAAYTLVDEDGKKTGPPRTAMFKVGRIVWLPARAEVKELGAARVVAWAEGTGTVSISRNVLAGSK